MLKTMHSGFTSNKSGGKITVRTYKPSEFTFTSTSKEAFKDFRVVEPIDKVICYSPDRSATKNAANPN